MGANENIKASKAKKPRHIEQRACTGGGEVAGNERNVGWGMGAEMRGRRRSRRGSRRGRSRRRCRPLSSPGRLPASKGGGEGRVAGGGREGGEGSREDAAALGLEGGEVGLGQELAGSLLSRRLARTVSR